MSQLTLTSTAHPYVIVAGDADERLFVARQRLAPRKDDIVVDGVLMKDDIRYAETFYKSEIAERFVAEHPSLVNPTIHSTDQTLTLNPQL